jgi:enamine deaminase RidA (YjgF/YER057c/UK114 family)
MKVAVGSKMSFLPGAVMPNFTSKTLNRTFDSIVFSAGPATAGGQGAASGMPGGDASHVGSKANIASLDKTIKAAGGRGLADMVTMTVFINDHHNGDRFTQIRKEIFKECFPASALITVTGFARPGLLLEIQGVAVIGGK